MNLVYLPSPEDIYDIDTFELVELHEKLSK